MYQLKGPYDHYFPGVIDPMSGLYLSNSFNDALFDVSNPSAHFGYGRFATYRDMGGSWIPDHAPNMPFDANDPLEGSRHQHYRTRNRLDLRSGCAGQTDQSRLLYRRSLAARIRSTSSHHLREPLE